MQKQMNLLAFKTKHILPLSASFPPSQAFETGTLGSSVTLGLRQLCEFVWGWMVHVSWSEDNQGSNSGH